METQVPLDCNDFAVRMEELRVKIEFLQTPGVDSSTIALLCNDTPFQATPNQSFAGFQSFKKACLCFYTSELSECANRLVA